MTDAETIEAIDAVLPSTYHAGRPLPERVALLVDERQRLVVASEPHTKARALELVELLRELAHRVAIGDSFEGNIVYTCLDDDCAAGEYKIRAVFRTGNLEGQGGVTMIGVSPS